MSDPRPRPPATPPPLPPEGITGEWPPTVTHELVSPAPVLETPTVTASGQSTVQSGADLGIPNPFGRYQITRLLGRGGMGAVFLAHDTQLQRPVALKIPSFQEVLTAPQKERFFREARAISALRHPNICPVFDVDEEEGFLYLTMAYIDGQPLSALIEHGPVPPEKAVELVRKIARTMQAAHSHGTIHRDLKPANVLVDGNGEPVVMDFGLARRADWGDDSRDLSSSRSRNESGLTQFGSVLGTPAYMPPEQARGDVAAVGTRSDVYSLGVILYELLTARRPFNAADTSELIRKIETEVPPRPTEFYPWLSPSIEAACLRAIAKDPADRFASMADFERALKEAVEPELRVVVPPPLPPSSAGRRPVAAPRKRRWVKVVTILGIFLALTSICVGGPVLAVYFLVEWGGDKFKEIQQAQDRSNVEWEAIMQFWQPPPLNAGPDQLFPVALSGGYTRTRHDQAVADPELGITLPGKRAFYRDSNGAEFEVRAYPCPEVEARALQERVQALVNSVNAGATPFGPDSSRKKVLYTASNSGIRTVTFGFSSDSGLSYEYGKLWYGQGWFFWFRTTEPAKIDFFPSRYLWEVGKKSAKQPGETMKKK